MIPIIRNFPLAAGSYVPIVAPVPCDHFLIIGNADGSAMQRSSDGTDANSYLLPAGGWYSFLAPSKGSRGSTFAFQAGDVVTYLKAISGIGPAVVEFS